MILGRLLVITLMLRVSSMGLWQRKYLNQPQHLGVYSPLVFWELA